jgi:hypothetical protein
MGLYSLLQGHLYLFFFSRMDYWHSFVFVGENTFSILHITHVVMIRLWLIHALFGAFAAVEHLLSSLTVDLTMYIHEKILIDCWSYFNSVQTDFGARPASCLMGTGGSFLGVKWQGLEADHSPPSSVKVKKDGAIPPLSHMSTWCNA